jgi:hypothetical protein
MKIFNHSEFKEREKERRGEGIGEEWTCTET